MADLMFSPDVLDAIVERFAKDAERRKLCEEKGHPGEYVVSNSQFCGPMKVHCFCGSCGAAYDRNPTKEEYDSWKLMLDRPMTI